MALLKYVQREGPVLKCDALSRKEPKHVNKCVRQALVPGEQVKVGMKHSMTLALTRATCLKRKWFL